MNVTLLISLVLAQVAEPSPSYNTTLNFHYYHQFESSIENGGDVEVSYTGAELRIDNMIGDEDDLQFRFAYQRDDWSFGGASGLGSLNPWETINTVEFSLQWMHQFNNQNRWYFGAIGKASYEDSASTSTQAGGTIAMAHSFSSGFTLGGGVGIIGQVNADPRLFPIFILNWKLADNLRLTSDISTRFGSRTGVELVWSPREDWEFGAGYSYSFQRFKLDGNGYAPNGAGEATAWPLSLRATYQVTPKFELTFLGGIVFGGHLEVVSSGRQLLQSEDFENAGAIGILGQISF